MKTDTHQSGIINRTAIVTGGNRGIGESIARAFSRYGYHVMIGAQTDTKIAENLGERARFQKTDVRRETDCHRLVQKTIEWTGRLDVFINCAGFSAWRSVGEVDEEFWNLMIDTNLKGVFFGCKAAAHHLMKNGCIINISSIAGKRGSANNSVYCASKFGVNGITQALAKERGPRGIRVNAVCPVYIATKGLIEALKDEQSPARGMDIEGYLEKFASENAALMRLPTGEEIANACLFLASDEASAITGQCINVDCGVLPQ
jgi:3-oxoacyl-[acyl-carrier protein] reductase/meso-butanediol dehydrogenase/(S,S)-butanediol dehydrogenase/diacetyl reductase